MKREVFAIGLVSAVVLQLMIVPDGLSEVRREQLNADNLLVAVKDDDWQPSTGRFDSGLAIPATWVDDAGITIDGMATEDGWELAGERTVPLYHGSASEAFLQALYTEEEVFLKVRWKDDSEDRQHHPWVWDGEKNEFVEGPQVEDAVMLSFEAACEWTPSFLSGYSFDFDGWQWLAARSDPLGQAVDLSGNVKTGYVRKAPYVPYVSRVSEDTWNMKFNDYDDGILHAKWNELDRVYLLQPVKTSVSYRHWPDGNLRKQRAQVTELQQAPADTADNRSRVHQQFKPLQLSGDAGEIRAKGHWADGYWTVEFQRALTTAIGGPDDVVLERLTQFSVHVFDHTERIDESSESGRLFLRFMEKGAPGEERSFAGTRGP